MTTGDDLFFRRSGRQLKNTDSVFRDQGQERGKCNFTVTKRKVIFLRATTVVNMSAEETGLA